MKKVFLSYSYADKSVAEVIFSDLSHLEDVDIFIDEIKIRYTDKIESFMKKIKKCDYSLIVVSDSFLKSENCMFEIIELFKDDEYKKKVLPIILQDNELDKEEIRGANIHTDEGILSYILYWKDRYEKLKSGIERISIEESIFLAERLRRMAEIRRAVGDFIKLLREIKYVKFSEEKKNGYRNIIEKIEGYKMAIKDIVDAKAFYSQAISQKNINRRIFFLKKAIERYENYYVQALNKLAQCYDDIGEFDEAIKLYDKALSLAKKKDAILISKSYSLIRKDKLHEALDVLKEALELSPERKEVHNNIADVYRRLRIYEKAKEHADKALEIDGTFFLAYATKAEIYADMGDNNAFFRFIEKAVEYGFPLHKYSSWDAIYKKYEKNEKFKKLLEFSKENNDMFI